MGYLNMILAPSFEDLQKLAHAEPVSVKGLNYEFLKLLCQILGIWDKITCATYTIFSGWIIFNKWKNYCVVYI